MKTNLQPLRKHAGYPNRDSFAAEIGVNPNTYKTWENGSVTINVEQAIMLCVKLGCSLDELLGTKEILSDKLALEERLLIDLYREMSDAGRKALVASAKGLHDAYRS